MPAHTPYVQMALLESIAKELLRTRRGGEAEVKTIDTERERERSLDWRKIFHSALPKNIRQLYVNAVQSALWNTVVAERCGNGRAESAVREGDLVLLDARQDTVLDQALLNNDVVIKVW